MEHMTVIMCGIIIIMVFYVDIVNFCRLNYASYKN
jgi:hypothetical protein